MASKYARFAEFWPYYLSEHSDARNRALHYAGSGLAVALLALAAAAGDWRLLPAAAVCGYAFAWFGHFFVERNRPATFDYPLWSFYADYRMLAFAAAGRLRGELERHGVTPKAPRAPR